ncbi:MFS transporter [Raphidocelis subcapitata]|uniref:MFS transporter n=1 Tax=Raphidocelis subcapitata TaxID=307507 RepID=A0A2V0PDV9_9CHLO|nr:MFS transporter [Raphidocelis subcapitata]|eukprot:GBF98026.1 MFS transporter [Raphidocelis subcapitata]
MGAAAAAAGGGGAPLAPRVLTRAQYFRTLLATTLGILLEWLDYIVYAQLQDVLSKEFFPSDDPTVAALSFWGVFAVGFVSRPAGSILFGHIGDVYGRKPCLLATVSIMGVATTLIGCLPSYAQIGVAAPVLLAVLRCVQGLAMGGEFGTALVYQVEVAPKKHKGTSGAGGFAASILGIMFGVASVMVIIAACTPEQLQQWGWRIPFLLGTLTAGAALLLRLHMEEPPEYEAARAAAARESEAASAAAEASAAEAGGGAGAAAAAPARRGAWLRRVAGFSFVQLMRDSWGRVALQFLFEASVSVSFWLATAYLPGFFRRAYGMPREMTLGALLVNLSAMLPAIMLGGWAADQPGWPRMGGALAAYAGIGAMCVPMFLGFRRGWAACWLLQLVFMLLLSLVLGMLPVTMSALYPPMQRASGFNFAHNCAMSLLGGLAPTVVTAIGLSSGNTLTAPGWYMLANTAVSMAAGIAIAWLVPGTRRAVRHDGGDGGGKGGAAPAAAGLAVELR